MENRAPEELLFSAPQSGPLRARNFRQRIFAPAVTKAELGHLKLTPHKLRHTAASLAIASGADVNVVQTMLGHKSATLTLDVYGHLFPDRLDEVSKKMHKRRTKQLAKAQKKLEKAERKAREGRPRLWKRWRSVHPEDRNRGLCIISPEKLQLCRAEVKLVINTLGQEASCGHVVLAALSLVGRIGGLSRHCAAPSAVPSEGRRSQRCTCRRRALFLRAQKRAH
ncbi:tyrosine-type recombinase/integrase [Streptomyces sp. NPDC006992]|uniref:tyrosine-type recombinase/integrase n=1 Tax=Streptomyces sp. NPDC006992 TaxID=3155601 RepID=UPI0033DED5EA